MKKILLLLTAMTIVTTSCNKNDDDNSSNSPDPILGKWFYHKSFKNGEEETLNDCDKKSYGNFTEAKSFIFVSYEIDGGDEECSEVDTFSGTWENLGNSNYKFSSPGEDDDTLKINFEGNTFSFTETSTYIQTDKDGNDVEVTDTYITYLIKK